MKKHKTVLAVVLLAVLLRLLYFFDFHEIWWDSGVYLGMAKYLWSFGKIGLLEHIRPVLWPAVIGFFWKLSLDIVFWSRLLVFALSIAGIWLVYAIAGRVFSKKAALFAGIMFAFSSIFFFFTFHSYTEIPAVFFVLCGIWLLLKNKPFASGLFIGLAFLTKFPAGIFVIAVVVYLVFKKQIKNSVLNILGFAVPVSAFLIFNWFVYGSFFGPLMSAQQAIVSVLGCNVLRFKPWWQYFVWIFVDNWLNMAAVIGIVLAAKKRSWLILGLLALPLVYFMQLSCRDYRYLILFLPFVAILAGLGLDFIQKKLPKKFKQVFLLLVIVVSVFNCVIFYQGNGLLSPVPAQEKYFSWLAENTVQGEIWSSNPVVSAYADVKVHKIYYPLYDKDQARQFSEYLRVKCDSVGAVLLDNCGGGIICVPDDTLCREEFEKTIAFLNENFRQVYFAEQGRCWYRIYVH